MQHQSPSPGSRRDAPERAREGIGKNGCRNAASSSKTARSGKKWGKGSGKGSPPISRVLSSGPIVRPARRAIIPLVDALPRRSSSLPGDSASSVSVPLFGLAPDGVYRAVRVTTSAVGSYPTVSPLPVLRKAIGGLLSVALSVAFTLRLWRPAVSRHPALRGPDFPRCLEGTAIAWRTSRRDYSGDAPPRPGFNRPRANRQPDSEPQ